ncbi:MAG: acetyl-CoA carboxylase biotin carboxyl carrier protein subunit [Saprospiraceae bacterium]|nr:acetyl-CoA carboxylase biotin carboxyl carrier protein subunit [Bacteroidia bacterium]MBT8229130.1 acetyl-CoA carboxylase biotin carboxyl carrier protein subunit [Bacteroidia bacterium]NNF20695.1 acetyl-CoA carboxylase biotin carboxyl carrier protein subunit [Saprospiraceae bacterium]NNK90725.1 acetyl-CoA carboxylase biotin carboxyl carrier protein subunit [Saprospiraceae bacterium]
MDQLIKAMGYADKKIQAFKELKAPMPGLILEIQVSEGQDIEEGDTLLILEAMKMENVIKAPGSGKVKRILLEKGAKVDKNEVIIEMA